MKKAVTEAMDEPRTTAEKEEEEKREGAGEEKREGEGGGREGVEGGRKESKEQRQISYDYEELKSRPEVVNISPDTYLELQYHS